MNVDKETQQLKELLDSFGNKKYAVIKNYLFDKANKHALSVYNKELNELSFNFHTTCNELNSVVEYYTPEYFIN